LEKQTGGKKTRLIIAIDGPAGSGKSTIARLLAQRLGLTYLDSGALYRALTYMCMKDGVDLKDVQAVVAYFKTLDVTLGFSDGTQKVTANGHDITAEIRTPEVTREVFYVAKEPAVRAEMFNRQRKFREQGGLVAEGRDMGTVVFADADFKFYLDASVEVRALRRHKELLEGGRDVPLNQLRDEIAHRDKTDIHRKAGPLKVADGAAVIDTSDMTIDEVLDAVVGRIEKDRQ
jgi:cytidylate kinase